MSFIVDILDILFFVDQEPIQDIFSSYSNKYHNIIPQNFNFISFIFHLFHLIPLSKPYRIQIGIFHLNPQSDGFSNHAS